MAFETTSVPVAELLCSPRSFDLFSSGVGYDESLLYARMHPPVALWREDVKEPTVVWGWELLRSLKAAGIIAAPAAEVVTDAGGALELALRVESRAGQYGWGEILAIGACIRHYRLHERAAELTPLVLGRPGSLMQAIERFEGLPEPLRVLVRAGTLDLKTAGRGAALPTEVAAVFAERAADLTFSQRRMVLGLVYEFCVMGQRDADEVIAMLNRAFETGDPPAALRAMRYPRLHELEQRFRGFCRQHLYGTGVTLHAPPQFEGTAFWVQFQFESKFQLAKRIAALRAVEHNCDELFQLL